MELQLEALTNNRLLDDMLLDRTIHRLKYLEPLRNGLIDEHNVWRRWLV